MDFSTIEITSKKVCGNNVDFSISKITPKKVRGNNVDFSNSEIALKKICGNDMDFSIGEITPKKYVEMTWKFVEIWSSTYEDNIDVKSRSTPRGVPVGTTFCSYFLKEILFAHFKSLFGRSNSDDYEKMKPKYMKEDM